MAPYISSRLCDSVWLAPPARVAQWDISSKTSRLIHARSSRPQHEVAPRPHRRVTSVVDDTQLV